MLYEEARKYLKGVAAIAITPLKEDYEPDLEGLRENVRFIVDNGIRKNTGFITITGATGDGPFLTINEHKRIWETVVDEVKDEVPVVIGTHERSIKSTIELLKYAEDLGVLCAQVAPPQYCPPLDEEIFRFYKEINDSLEIGIQAYNNYYTRAGVDLSESLISKLTQLEKVVSLKWATKNWNAMMRVIWKYNERFNIILNHQSVVEGYILGIKGIVSLISNFYPQHDLELWESLEKRQYEKATQLLMKLRLPLYEFRSKNPGVVGVGIGSFFKALNEICGRPVGPAMPPQGSYSEDQKEQLRKILIEGGVESALL